MSSDHVEEKDIPVEPVMREGENFIPGRSNQLIIFGRDRPAGIDSGHGSEPNAGTIHIVVGRKSQDVSLADDSAFIYATMRTDTDKNLGLDGMKDGKGGGLEAHVGPTVIAKSDAIRMVHRATGDIRITSEDGSNYIRLSPDRCEIKIGASWLKVEDGTITVEAGTIKLGSEASRDKVILGNNFMDLIFNKHTHQSPVGPTSFPLLQMTEAQLSRKSLVE